MVSYLAYILIIILGILKVKKKFGISDNVFFIKVINEKIILGEKYAKY